MTYPYAREERDARDHNHRPDDRPTLTDEELPSLDTAASHAASKRAAIRRLAAPDRLTVAEIMAVDRPVHDAVGGWLCDWCHEPVRDGAKVLERDGTWMHAKCARDAEEAGR